MTPSNKIKHLKIARKSKAKSIDFTALGHRVLEKCTYHIADASGRISQFKFVFRHFITSVQSFGVVSFCAQKHCP